MTKFPLVFCLFVMYFADFTPHLTSFINTIVSDVMTYIDIG